MAAALLALGTALCAVAAAAQPAVPLLYGLLTVQPSPTEVGFVYRYAMHVPICIRIGSKLG